MKIYKKLFVIVLASLIFSCQKNDVDDSISQQQVNPNDLVVQKLTKKGWQLSQIQPIHEDFYLVGNDFLYSANINDYSIGTNPSKQARSQDLVDPKYIQKVRVFVEKDLISLDNDWDNITNKAIVEWNGIKKCKVNLIRVSDLKDADIIINWDDGFELEDHVFASASFPINQKAGNRIIINPDYKNSNGKPVSSSQKLNNLIHEFGHTLGLRHTNYKALKEPSAIIIPGTPEQDAASVMNGKTAENKWKGFSKHDKQAIRTLYPE